MTKEIFAYSALYRVPGEEGEDEDDRCVMKHGKYGWWLWPKWGDCNFEEELAIPLGRTEETCWLFEINSDRVLGNPNSRFLLPGVLL